MEHPFINLNDTDDTFPRLNFNIDCKLFFADEEVFLLIVLVWVIVLGLWIVLNWKKSRYTTLLQKILIVLPILKLIDTLAYYLFLKQCPWATDKTEFTTKYLIMSLVTVSSIYQSIAIGIIMILSSGWSLLHYQMDRDYATKVTVFMGVIYLSYSAYYVSIPNSSFRIFMEVLIIVTYSYIFYFCVTNLSKILRILELFCQYMEDNNAQYLLEATRLKFYMTRRFFYILIFFFSIQILFQGIIPLILEWFDKSLYFTTTLDMMQEIFDFIIFTSLLINYRARNWPQYFLATTFDLSNIDDFLEANKNYKIPDIYKANITESMFESSIRT